MSWVNYRAGGIGEVVDRFRWEGGCIVEHVSSCFSCGFGSEQTEGEGNANTVVRGSGIKGRSTLLRETVIPWNGNQRWKQLNSTQLRVQS